MTADGDSLRVPPHSIEVEQAVLGGLMLRPDAFSEVSDWLTEADFYRRDHQLIFGAIAALAVAGKPCDAVTLAEWFDAHGESEMVSARYVIDLANNTPSAANVGAYAEIVAEKSRLRQLIDLGSTVGAVGFRPANRTSADICAEFQVKLASLQMDNRAGGLRAAREAVDKWVGELARRYDAKQDMTGLATPWAEFNDRSGGLQAGDLVVLAGRTSMGKSVMGGQLAVFTAIAGHRTALFSIEMRADQVVQRSVACFGRIDHESLRHPARLADAEWPLITTWSTAIREAPLWIDDQSRLMAHQIVARAKREHLRKPLSLIVVDHLHEMGRPGRNNESEELGDSVRALKGLAKQLRVPVILLAQLNRANTHRTDHRPNLGDLRGSGSIEEVADVVLLLHREDYYRKTTHLQGVVEVIIGKGRDMPVGQTIHLRNEYGQMRLVDWVGPLPEAPKKEAAKRKRNLGGAADDKSKDGDQPRGPDA